MYTELFAGNPQLGSRVTHFMFYKGGEQIERAPLARNNDDLSCLAEVSWDI